MAEKETRREAKPTTNFGDRRNTGGPAYKASRGTGVGDAAERMIGAGSTTFSYYNNGNRISRTEGLVTTRYSYDFEDRMTKAGSKSYQRDHFGRVVSSGGGAIRYLFERGERDPGGGGGYYDPTHSGVR